MTDTNSTKPSSPSSLEFGAYNAVCSYGIFLLVYYAGYNPFGINGWLGAWLPVVFISLAIKRDKMLGKGYISYRQAFRTGFNTSISFALLFSVMVYVSATIFMENLIDMQRIETLESLDKGRSFLSNELYQETKKSAELTSISTICMADFFMKVLGGTIASLFIAAFMNKSKPETQNEIHE